MENKPAPKDLISSEKYELEKVAVIMGIHLVYFWRLKNTDEK